MSDPYTEMDYSAEQVLIAHGRTRIEGCYCGWGMDGSKLGQSHALHVWRELQRAVLPDHDARTRAQVAERITREAAGWRIGPCDCGEVNVRELIHDLAALAHATTEGDPT